MERTHFSRGAFLLALLLCIGGLGAAVNAADSPPYRPPDPQFARSDIFMSSRWERVEATGILEAFAANRMVWTYSHNPRFIAEVHAAGATYSGAIDAGATPAPGVSIDLKGRPLVAPWQINFIPVRYRSDASREDYQAALLQLIKDYLAVGADGIHFDDWRMNYGTLAWGGCFTDSAMAQFRTYLGERLTDQQLAELGVTDLAAFDFREHLAFKHGIRDSKSFWDRRQNVPLFPYYRDFTIHLTREILRGYKEQLDEISGDGGHIPISANANLEAAAQEHWFIADLVDYFIGESDAGMGDLRTLLTNVSMANALGLPLVVTPRKADQVHLALRHSIALTYAMGQFFLVPWDVWSHDDVRYFGSVEEFADLYQFIARNRQLFDGYDLNPHVGVIANTAADQHNHLVSIYSEALFKGNVPFEIVAVGARYMDVTPDADVLSRFRYLVETESVDTLQAPTVQAIREAEARGTVLLSRGEFVGRLRDGSLSPIRVTGGEGVYVVVRVKADDPDAPVVLHILNRNADVGSPPGPSEGRVTLELLPSDLWRRGIAQANLYTPDSQNGVPLVVRTTDAGVALELPPLGVWSIVTLR